jgi:hypothetical protein
MGASRRVALAQTLEQRIHIGTNGIIILLGEVPEYYPPIIMDRKWILGWKSLQERNSFVNYFI